MLDKNIKIGFSTGCFHKSGMDLAARIKIIKKLGCRALEINFLRPDEFSGEKPGNLSAEYLEGFEYLSFHAPKYNYGDNEGTTKITKKIWEINAMRKLDVIVFHPSDAMDTGAGMEFFREMGFPVAFENMDCRNFFWRTTDEMVQILRVNGDFRLVLDLNHVYTNDRAMGLAAGFYEKLGNKISHIHLSGYNGPNTEQRHTPLFKTKQIEIIKAVRKPESTPIIIESSVLPEEAKLEYEYILKNLG